jgi:hypothetical protein
MGNTECCEEEAKGG